MEVKELEEILQEIRERENFLVKLKLLDVPQKQIDKMNYHDKPNKLIMCIDSSYNSKVFKPSNKELQYLKDSCIFRINELKRKISPVLDV